MCWWAKVDFGNLVMLADNVESTESSNGREIILVIYFQSNGCWVEFELIILGFFFNYLAKIVEVH
jgi:hypothetical protein